MVQVLRYIGRVHCAPSISTPASSAERVKRTRIKVRLASMPCMRPACIVVQSRGGLASERGASPIPDRIAARQLQRARAQLRIESRPAETRPLRPKKSRPRPLRAYRRADGGPIRRSAADDQLLVSHSPQARRVRPFNPNRKPSKIHRPASRIDAKRVRFDHSALSLPDV
ncbi:uncharacterized protein PAN0_012c4442 [Moesziomyces antarcticus]|uniref:Uncharacterized protein n=1 Tax=Pseudozyma antarctica TaxID=84753 RepID=A0A081CHS4_PSEA2|nr:uncharacterized protein PAN0_012c4442 [Moesziomyces antarcticus]GAK66220.1 hypothetical protein PAN0_012c4442 [Moesziomyces antarcticus]